MTMRQARATPDSKRRPKARRPDCPDCPDPLDHCHGALIVHSDGALVCTLIDCYDRRRARHTVVLSCERLVPGCACEAKLR